MDQDQFYGVRSRFYYADAIGCAWRTAINCSDFDTQPKLNAASTSEASWLLPGKPCGGVGWLMQSSSNTHK